MHKKFLSFPLLVLLLLFVIAGLFITNQRIESIAQQPSTPCIPTFADGDGPYYQPNSQQRTTLVPDTTKGEKLLVKGKVYKNDCRTPFANVILDIWQADENGKYQKEWYRGRVQVDNKGNYSFTTIKPKGYGEGTGYRPPHIHFKVWDNNQLLITSEMFFPDVKGKKGFNDAFIVQLEEKKSLFGAKSLVATHNIIVP